MTEPTYTQKDRDTKENPAVCSLCAALITDDAAAKAQHTAFHDELRFAFSKITDAISGPDTPF